MNVQIAGMGWVTPLGADLALVESRLRAGDKADIKTLTNPENGQLHSYVQVPPKLVESLGRHPRLRRASPISYFAVAAGLAALEDAGVPNTPEAAERTAIVFAIADGGVQYTRRFYEQIVKQGANAASPMLFPETVYNAPASHLAAQLGLNGASYTLVGDGAIGLAALHFAGQLLETLDIDRCVVVSAEESDWILCQAYADWRLARTPLAEGAAAVVLSRAGRFTLQTHPGACYFRRAEAAAALGGILSELKKSGPVDLVVRSANRSFVDEIEAAALDCFFPGVRAISPKLQLGEALGASALMQLIVGALAVEKGEAAEAVVTSVGFNQQVGAARVGGL